MADPPPAYCHECGSVVLDVINVEYWRDAIIAEAIQRRQRKALMTEADRDLRNHRHYEKAMEILRYWRETCRPHAKELEGVRLKNVLARLEGGTTVAELKRAVYGYSLKPYMVNGRRSHQGPRDDWLADAEFIFRTEGHVAKGIDIAERASELQTAFSASGASSHHTGLSALGAGALKAVRTFAVFPVKPADKHPATPHGFKDALRDPDRIRAYWTKRPDANIGIPTGRENGIVVLDVDGDFGYETLTELEDRYDALPDTLSVKTPRGGSHLYFQHPGITIQNSASLLGPALDVRGDGGYVLVPPSVGSNGNKYVIDEEMPMQPMPDWLVKLIKERQRKINEALTSGDLELFFSTGASEGNRNDRLFSFACKERGSHSPADLAFIVHGMNKAWVKPPLDDREVDQIVKSALRYEGQ